MIKKIDVNDIPKRAKPKNSVQEDVERFWKSGWEACEIDASRYKSVSSALSSYGCAAKRLKVGVVAISRGDRVFLVRRTNT